jgi:hypothetical protein
MPRREVTILNGVAQIVVIFIAAQAAIESLFVGLQDGGKGHGIQLSARGWILSTG